MRVIIAGGRNFNNFELLESEVIRIFRILKSEGIFNTRNDITIISGTAKGADKLGEKFAEKYNLKLERFPADWSKYGKSAGYKRNQQMSIFAKEDNGVLIAFWNQTSKGTKHMIDIATRDGLKVFVVLYGDN